MEVLIKIIWIAWESKFMSIIPYYISVCLSLKQYVYYHIQTKNYSPILLI